MTTIQKFLFDVSFDSDGPGSGTRRGARAQEPPPPPPPPPEPTFSAADLEQARNAGYAEGLAAGHADGYGQGRAEVEGENQTAIADALIRLADGVETLVADRDELNETRTSQPMQIAHTIIAKLLPNLIRRHGGEELEAFIAACVNEAVDEPRLMIRVSNALLADLRPGIEEIASQRGFGGRLVILGDPALGPSDARIEWADGGAERNTAQLLADIGKVADRMLGGEDNANGETRHG